MIFGKYLLTKECRIVYQFFTYVICDKTLIQKMFIPKIYYVINGINIEFKRNSMFDCEESNEGQCKWNIVGLENNESIRKLVSLCLKDILLYLIKKMMRSYLMS
jgi:hypothetical protein